VSAGAYLPLQHRVGAQPDGVADVPRFKVDAGILGLKMVAAPLKVGNEPSRREIDFIGMRDYSPRYPREDLFPGKSV
jgi:hypothetical protein